MNYWITYLGVGCIYIADDRRKCWDASPVPWCKVEASCDLVLSCQVFGACQVHTSHHMWLVINPPFSQSLSFPAIKNRLGSFQKLQKKNVSPCSKISYESRNPFKKKSPAFKIHKENLQYRKIHPDPRSWREAACDDDGLIRQPRLVVRQHACVEGHILLLPKVCGAMVGDWGGSKAQAPTIQQQKKNLPTKSRSLNLESTKSTLLGIWKGKI